MSEFLEPKVLSPDFVVEALLEEENIREEFIDLENLPSTLV